VWAAGYLQLEKTYHTKCLSLYERVVPDGRNVYLSQGFFKDNYFTRLDLLSGECGKVAPLPSMEFSARAFSAQYMFAMDGIYNRHSIYRKSGWTRTGTLRLSDGVSAAAIEGDTLYLLQQGHTQDRTFHLNRFALPQMRLRSTQALDFQADRVISAGHSFVFADAGKLATYDVETGAVRRTAFPVSLHGTEALPGGKSATIGCGSDAKLVGGGAVMVHTSCHGYTLFDLATLNPRFEIALGDNAIFANGFVSGRLLYVLAESTTEPSNYRGGVHDDVRVVDAATGRTVATPPPLVSDEYTYALQVEDRLVWAIYDPKAQDFRVEIYRMQPASL
jgi:hypothetical protein